jgi:ComF family protein
VGITETGLRRLLRDAARPFADVVFPPLCALCGGEDPGDGLGCGEHRLPLCPSGPRCGRCAAALPPAIASGERCAGCRLDPPSFESAIVLGDYRAQPAIRDWILALKHGRRSDLARTLGRALGARFAADRDPRIGADLGPPILVPVPLHWMRRLDRGYDQARLVAEAAATVEDLGVVPALARSRSTAVQGSIGAPSRSANVARAFRPRRAFFRGSSTVAGRQAWIVDDVVTSGATASECARALKRLGAARVGLLALARA